MNLYDEMKLCDVTHAEFLSYADLNLMCKSICEEIYVFCEQINKITEGDG